MDSFKGEKLAFNGTGDIKEFLTEVDLISTVKG